MALDADQGESARSRSKLFYRALEEGDNERYTWFPEPVRQSAGERKRRSTVMEMKELLIVLVVMLVVFGAKKLRSVGEDLGRAVRGFKKAMNEGEEDEVRVAGSGTRKQIRSDGAGAEFPERAYRSAEPASSCDRAA